jgi:hypothetical protein
MKYPRENASRNTPWVSKTPPISRNNAVISVDLFIMASDFPSLSRLRPQFLERAQEGDDVFAVQHTDNLAIGHHGELVDTIAVHLLEGAPQFLVRTYAFQLFQREHDLSGARRRPLVPRHFLDPMQSHQADCSVFAIDEEAALPAAENVFVHQLL